MPTKLSLFDDKAYDYLEYFLCEKTRFMYLQEEKFQNIDEVNYQIRKHFDASCKITKWADDRVRINYMLAVGGALVNGKVIDTRRNDKNMGRLQEKINTQIKTTETFEYSKAGDI